MFSEVDRLAKWLWQMVSSSATWAVGVAANMGVVALTLPFASTPSGASIRPMGWAALMVMIALCTVVLGAIAAVFDAVGGRGKAALADFLLCLAPFPVASVLLNLLAVARGFHLSDWR